MSEPSKETHPDEISLEERCLWICRAMEEDSEALEMRERTYPWTNSHSFGLLKSANFTSCSAHLDRHRVLELIYQHLHSIGLHSVAYTLAQESQLEFQRKDQKMDRTDLRLLVSMSLGPRDNLWDDTGIENTVLSEEPFDEDNESVRYVEPLNKVLSALNGDQSAVEFKPNSPQEFSNIAYAPLSNLIVFLLKSDQVKCTEADRQVFYLCLNSMCSSEHFFEHLKKIYDNSEEFKQKVLELINEWVRFSGLFIGKKTLSQIRRFIQGLSNPIAATLYQDIPNVPYGCPITQQEIPLPSINDPELLFRPDLTLEAPDPEEVARQISLAVHSLFAAIHPRELYFAISNRSLSLETSGLNELFEFGRKLKLLIASTILNCATTTCNSNDKSSILLLIKNLERMISIANKLIEINNFEALSWFVSAFNMKCIVNLSETIDLPTGLSNSLKELRSNYDWKKVSQSYQTKLDQCYNQKIPAIPNMRYELSLVAVKGYGGDEFKINGDVTTVNWQKRHVCGDLLRFYNQFQNIKYNYYNISQIQRLISDGLKYSKQELNAISIKLKNNTGDAKTILLP